MAEEVGAGYVSLVPSMRNFSKLVKAELKKALAGTKGQGVEIPVTPVFDQKTLNESLKANKKPLKVPVQFEPINGAGGKVKPVRVPVEVDRAAFRRSLAGASKDSRSTIHQKVTVDADRNFVRGQVADAFKQGGTTAAGLFGQSFGVSLPVLILGVITAILGAPLIAAATGALILSGAALGAVFFGAFLLRGDKELKAGVESLFKEVKDVFKEAAQPLKGPFLESLGIIKDAFRDIAPDIKGFFSTIAKSGGIQELARGFGKMIKSFSETGALKKLGESIGPVLKQIGMALPDIGNAVSQFIISITKPSVIEFVGKLLRFVADLVRFIGSAIGFLASFAGLVQRIFTGILRIANFVVALFNGSPKAIAILTFAVRSAVAWIKEKWQNLWNSVSSKVTTTISSVASTVKGIPGKITSALGNTSTLLLQAGKNIVNGLIDGIRNKLGALGNIASQMAGTVRSFLPFSPAKQGPLSGSGNPYHSGQVIAGDLAMGMTSKLPTVNSASNQLASAVQGGSAARAAAPASGQLEWVGGNAGDEFMQWLRENIRIRNGGNVTAALGS